MIISFDPATFDCSSCNNQGDWAVMYICDTGIDIDSSSMIFLLAFENAMTGWYPPFYDISI